MANIVTLIDISYKRYQDNCPRGKLAPRLGLWFGLGLGLVLGFGRNFPHGHLS